MPQKKKQRTSCPAAVKEACWRKYNGNSLDGKCFCCGTHISYTSFEAGHNKAFKKGGKWTIGNTLPLCRTCNRSMGTESITKFKKEHFGKEKKFPKQKGLFGKNQKGVFGKSEKFAREMMK
jgi:5-methylcytosine-specific restriction endonuclease McrA